MQQPSDTKYNLHCTWAKRAPPAAHRTSQWDFSVAASHSTLWRGATTHARRLRGGLNDISSHVGGTRAAAAIMLESHKGNVHQERHTVLWLAGGAVRSGHTTLQPQGRGRRPGASAFKCWGGRSAMITPMKRSSPHRAVSTTLCKWLARRKLSRRR